MAIKQKHIYRKLTRQDLHIGEGKVPLVLPDGTPVEGDKINFPRLVTKTEYPTVDDFLYFGEVINWYNPEDDAYRLLTLGGTPENPQIYEIVGAGGTGGQPGGGGASNWDVSYEIFYGYGFDDLDTVEGRVLTISYSTNGGHCGAGLLYDSDLNVIAISKHEQYAGNSMYDFFAFSPTLNSLFKQIGWRADGAAVACVGIYAKVGSNYFICGKLAPNKLVYGLINPYDQTSNLQSFALPFSSAWGAYQIGINNEEQIAFIVGRYSWSDNSKIIKFGLNPLGNFGVIGAKSVTPAGVVPAIDYHNASNTLIFALNKSDSPTQTVIVLCDKNFNIQHQIAMPILVGRIRSDNANVYLVGCTTHDIAGLPSGKKPVLVKIPIGFSNISEIDYIAGAGVTRFLDLAVDGSTAYCIGYTQENKYMAVAFDATDLTSIRWIKEITSIYKEGYISGSLLSNNYLYFSCSCPANPVVHLFKIKRSPSQGLFTTEGGEFTMQDGSINIVHKPPEIAPVNTTEVSLSDYSISINTPSATWYDISRTIRYFIFS